MNVTPGSFRAIRDRIRRLSADPAGSDPAQPHDLEAARRVRAIGAKLTGSRPVAPSALSDPAFLAGIYDRATRGAAAAIGSSLLRRAFAPMAAPRDVAWIEPEDNPDLAELLREVPPRSSASRWRAPPRLVQTSRRFAPLAVAAAAIFVVAGALVVFRGTSPAPDLVFQASDVPLTSENCSLFVLRVADR